ncbi:MAG: hypothetical protein H7A44_05475 [Opitutaceae bacterium]|nr:hypothetical protein [Opitutaceae bacterium]
MHQFIFSLVAAICYISALAVGFGDLGDDATISYRTKAVAGFLIPAIYFTWATLRERKMTSKEDEESSSAGSMTKGPIQSPQQSADSNPPSDDSETPPSLGPHG